MPAVSLTQRSTLLHSSLSTDSAEFNNNLTQADATKLEVMTMHACFILLH